MSSSKLQAPDAIVNYNNDARDSNGRWNTATINDNLVFNVKNFPADVFEYTTPENPAKKPKLRHKSVFIHKYFYSRFCDKPDTFKTDEEARAQPRKEKRKTGYNIFLSDVILKHTKGRTIQTPRKQVIWILLQMVGCMQNIVTGFVPTASLTDMGISMGANTRGLKLRELVESDGVERWCTSRISNALKMLVEWEIIEIVERPYCSESKTVLPALIRVLPAFWDLFGVSQEVVQRARHAQIQREVNAGRFAEYCAKHNLEKGDIDELHYEVWQKDQILKQRYDYYSLRQTPENRRRKKAMELMALTPQERLERAIKMANQELQAQMGSKDVGFIPESYFNQIKERILRTIGQEISWIKAVIKASPPDRVHI